MPVATKDKTAPTGKVQTKTVTTVVTDPVEQTLPPPAVATIEPREDFWKYIESLTPEDWKTHHVTLYRYPLGQVKPQRLGRYVKTYKAENPLVSEDQIFEEFGGSQYDAMLKGPGKNGERWTLLAKHSWEIDGPAKDPWKTSAGNGAPPPSDTAAILDTLLKHLQSLQASKNPAQDPAVKDSIALIQQLTTAMPKPEGVKELIAGLASLQQLTGGNGGGRNDLRETLSLLKELGIIGEKNERRSLAQELKEVMEVAGMITGGGGDGGGRRMDWGTALVQNLPSILEKVTPIADKFADAARSNARVAEISAGGRPRPMPSVPTQTAPPTPAAAVAPAAESPAPRVIAAPETEPATPQDGEPVQPPNLIWVKARAVQLFMQGKGGDQVAEWLDTLDKQLGDMLGSMDEENFRLFVTTDPILKQIADAPRFPEFVRDFVGYFEENDAPESGGADKS